MSGKSSGFAILLGLALCASAGAASADIMPNPKLDGGIALANIAISVSNLDRSAKFYQALGFEAGDVHVTPPAIVAKALGAPNSTLDIRFVKRDGVFLELVHLSPAPPAPPSKGPAKQLGWSHIALRVDDVDRVAAIIKQNGGQVIETTRTKMGEGPQAVGIVYCADPDGALIELVGPTKG